METIALARQFRASLLTRGTRWESWCAIAPVLWAIARACKTAHQIVKIS
ncbi:MAG: hypothetical protein ACFE0J_17765 [Elainellaceae cyanobacterium]